MHVGQSPTLLTTTQRHILPSTTHAHPSTQNTNTKILHFTTRTHALPSTHHTHILLSTIYTHTQQTHTSSCPQHIHSADMTDLGNLDHAPACSYSPSVWPPSLHQSCPLPACFRHSAETLQSTHNGAQTQANQPTQPHTHIYVYIHTYTHRHTHTHTDTDIQPHMQTLSKELAREAIQQKEKGHPEEMMQTINLKVLGCLGNHFQGFIQTVLDGITTTSLSPRRCIFIGRGHWRPPGETRERNEPRDAVEATEL